jgi:signal transduction histidine kinase
MGSAISAIAHDMRNPLTAIGGFARLLEEKAGIDADSRRKLRFIIQRTDMLEFMVNDMLDFSRPLDLRLTKVLETSERGATFSVSLPLLKEAPVSRRA